MSDVNCTCPLCPTWNSCRTHIQRATLLTDSVEPRWRSSSWFQKGAKPQAFTRAAREAGCFGLPACQSMGPMGTRHSAAPKEPQSTNVHRLKSPTQTSPSWVGDTVNHSMLTIKKVTWIVAIATEQPTLEERMLSYTKNTCATQTTHNCKQVSERELPVQQTLSNRKRIRRQFQIAVSLAKIQHNVSTDKYMQYFVNKCQYFYILKLSLWLMCSLVIMS